MNPDSTVAVTNTCPKDGVHLSFPFGLRLVGLVSGRAHF